MTANEELGKYRADIRNTDYLHHNFQTAHAVVVIQAEGIHTHADARRTIALVALNQTPT